MDLSHLPLPEGYVYRTEPLQHQRDLFEATKDLESFGLLWEQGVGKTKPTIDTTAYLYETGKIDAVLVVAPNGVQRNWANDQIQEHLPERILERANILVHKSSGALTKKAKAARKSLLNWESGLRVFCISYQGILTKTGKSFCERFMTKYRTIIVADESQRIKTPKAQVTKRMCAWGGWAKYRRILSGTPITQGAFDIYSQILFLDPKFWVERELSPFSVFKTHFGVFVSREEYERDTGFTMPKGLDKNPVDYKNLDELAEYIKSVSHRLTKETAGIHLPPKVYSKRYFSLSKKQRLVYDELYEDFETQLPESGDWLEAPESLPRIIRLQQITSGYVATEAGEPVQRIDSENNPRLDLLLETLEDCPGKAIVWAKFTIDIDILVEALSKIGPTVRYDGLVSDDEREENKVRFQSGDARFFVGKPQSGATGLTLHSARSVHYFSNSYNFEHRAQSEDRAHRIGLKHSVTYYDYIAENTIDGDIVRNLRKKNKFSQRLLGDSEKEWI